MKQKISLFLTLALTFFAPQAFSLDLSVEIQQLNKDFGNALSYPILILDKPQLRLKLAQKKLLESADEEAIASEIANFIQTKSNITLDPSDAIALVPYVTSLNGSALAQPFFDRNVQPYKMKYCIVLPNGVTNTHAEETKRVLGIQGDASMYKGLDTRRAQGLLSLEELQLFSLYHELSHCLDKKYLPRMYDQDPDGHQIHLAESFAEVNALFLLAQRKDLTRLGVPRSLLRTLYSKYFGPYLAAQPPSIAGPAYNQGGAIYFLSIPLLEAQHVLEKNRMQALELPAILNLSQRVVDNHTLKSRSFQAVLLYFKEGSNAFPYYKELAESSPDLFYSVYVDLLHFQNIFTSAENFLPAPMK